MTCSLPNSLLFNIHVRFWQDNSPSDGITMKMDSVWAERSQAGGGD